MTELTVVITAPIVAAAAPIQPITMGIVAPPVNGIAQIAAIAPPIAATVPTTDVIIFQTYLPSPYLNQSAIGSKAF